MKKITYWLPFDGLKITGIILLIFMMGPGPAIAAEAERVATGEKDADQARMLQIQPRYYRWFVDPGVKWVETNTRYASLDWEIPLDQCALVLVDVWNGHYLIDTEARSETIIRETIVPLLDQCREAGLRIIHCPAPRIAKSHPNWVNLEKTPRTQPTTQPVKKDEWPPRAFRSKSGEYAKYSKPVEARLPERKKSNASLDFHPLIMPAKDDPVVATGEELRLYCKKEGILFLFYLGFNTNACMLGRDYGMNAMRQHGFDTIILRDCGTAMESFETAATLAQTKNAILQLEMFGKFSLTSEELIAGLPK